MIDFLPITMTISSRDVGATQMVTIKLGTIKIGSYMAHTRYHDTAIENTAAALAAALKPLIDAAMDADGMEPVVPGHDYDYFLDG